MSAIDLDSIRLGRGKRVPELLQSEASECGLACLAMIASYHGFETDIASLRRRFPISSKGATLKSVMRIADALHLESRPVRVELDHLADLPLPAILHWNFNHFVVLAEVRRSRRGVDYVIHDPAAGVLIVPQAAMSRSFTGVALELAPAIDFAPAKDRTRLRLRQLWSTSSGLTGAATQIVGFSLLVNLLAIVAPFYLQVAIDSALPANDFQLLALLSVAFAAVALILMAAAWLRARTLVAVSQLLAYQMTANVVRHLIRLPLSWFEKRHVGDVIARFTSTQPISDLLANQLLESIIDGLFSVAALIMIFVFSPLLGLLTLGALLVYAAISLGLVGRLNRLNRDAIMAQAGEMSVNVETLYGIAAIRAFGVENDRVRLWRTRKAKSVNSAIRFEWTRSFIEVSEQGILALEQVAFVLVAVGLAMADDLTLGTIFALVAYRAMFLRSAVRLITAVRGYRQLDVHLERLTDIVHCPPEQPEAEERQTIRIDFEGAIGVRGLCFAFGIGEPQILSGLDLDIAAGDSVAIVGESGCGKTTLVRLIAGLLEPTEGAIFMDGRNFRSVPRPLWRRALGYVAQDDMLFAGTLADNIAFYDPDLDMDLIERAARLAVIHDDIMAMPMRYESLVGDMGSALSGGQKARVLLARALYRSPKVLIMDEGTAHLDVATEARVSAGIASLGITRIFVAHRPETIRSAQRVLRLVDGRLQEIDLRAIPAMRDAG